MANTMIRRSPFDVFAPFLASRGWDDWLRASGEEDGDRMITPALDVYEDEDAYTVTTELPGLKKDDIDITIEDGVLSISGEKKFEHEERKQSYHRVERRYGTFRRSVSLPSGVDTEKADATMTDGVLKVVLPKSEAARPKTLKIS